MKSNKKTRSRNHKFQPILIVSLLVGLILVLGSFVYKNNLLNIRDSDAQSKHYSKTYPAGDVVEKGRVRVLNYNDADYENNNEDPNDQSIPYTNWRSIGKKVKISPKKGSAKINGWATTVSPNIPRMRYISKLITIPKPENNQNRPMAIQLCWKAKNYNANVSISLYREKAKSWYPEAVNYNHRNESDKTASRLGCYGFSEYVYDTNDYGDPVNRQIKVRVYVAVLGGPIEIAAIKVKSIDLPTGDYVGMRADYVTGKYFGDGTNIQK